MKWLAALLLSIGLMGPAAAEPPSNELRAAGVALFVADWLQTRYIADNPQVYYEHNPLLGSHPSIGRVNVHFATVIAGYLWATSSSGFCNRTCATGVVVLEGTNVLRNFSIGIRFYF